MGRALYGIWFGVLMMLSSVSFGGIGLDHQLTFEIPDLKGGIQQVVFYDLDGDGISEVLVTDSLAAHLYSIKHDSVLFTFVMKPDYERHRILLADANRDSIADIVIAYYFRDGIAAGDSVCKVELFDGASGFDSVYSASYGGGASSVVGAPTPTGTLQSFDIDKDGYNEMLFSVYQLGSGSIWGIGEYTAGSTFCYLSFPDSLSWNTRHFVNGVNALSMPGDEGELVAHSYHWDYMEIYSPDQQTRTEELFLVGAGGVFSDLLSASQPGGCGPSVRQSDITMTAVFGTAVETGESQVLPEFVAVTTSATSCLLPDYQIINNSEVELGLYRGDGQSTLATIWQRDITGHSYSHFMYHPQLPGYFFAFVDGELAMLRASNGTIRYSITDIPVGAKHWDYPYDDGVPRLVVINEPYISFYVLDVVTGVDESQQSLPGRVVLEQNYPNPFNSTTTITFELPVRSIVDVSVFNVLGQRVVTLVNDLIPAGRHAVQWDGTEESGNNVASGLYLYRLTAGEVVQSRKILLLK